MGETIIVCRSGALGDVVLTTPILRRLHRIAPAAKLHIATAYPDVYKHCPYVTPLQETPSGDFKLISLDLAYERRPSMHIAQAYMQEVFGDDGDPEDLTQELVFSRRKMLPLNRSYVAVHAAQTGWSNRTLPSSTWIRVLAGLRKQGLIPIIVGAQRDMLETSATTFRSTNLQAIAQVISSCVCFVGSDSGLLHVAGATATPIVGVFTCASPETRLPWRHGVLGHNCAAVVADVACAGCLHERAPPVTDEYCRHAGTVRHNACVTAITPAAIIDAVLRLIG